MSLPWYKRLQKWILLSVPAVAAAATTVIVGKLFGLFGDPNLEIRDFRVEPITAPPSMTEPVVKRWFQVPGIFQSDQPKHLNKIIFIFHKAWGISVQNCKTTLVKDMAITESMATSKDIAKFAADVELEFTVQVGGVENGHLKEGGLLKFYVECDGAFSKSVVATLR
jgi:hypothetical protein